MSRRLPLLVTALATVGLFIAAPASAAETTSQLMRDFEDLLDAKQWGQAEAHARARLDTNPADLPAGVALARVILLSRQRDRTDEALGYLEKAIGAEPGNACLHFFAGELWGEKARGGGLGALAPARRSKASLARAVELEPHNFEYVYALNEYLLEAPFIAGGSASRARKAARDFSTIDSDGGSMLKARTLIVDREFGEAFEILRSLKRRDVELYDVSRRMLLVEAALGMVDNGRAAEVLPVVTGLLDQFPNNAAVHLAIGRARFATGDVAGSVASLGRSLEISRRLETLYHLAIAQQAAGDIEGARVLLTEASAAAKGSMADDIARRLAAL